MGRIVVGWLFPDFEVNRVLVVGTYILDLRNGDVPNRPDNNRRARSFDIALEATDQGREIHVLAAGHRRIIAFEATRRTTPHILVPFRRIKCTRDCFCNFNCDQRCWFRTPFAQSITRQSAAILAGYHLIELGIIDFELELFGIAAQLRTTGVKGHIDQIALS